MVARDIVAGGVNAFAATVHEMEFLGSFYRASLSAGSVDDATFVADFSVNLVRDVGVEEGMTLMVAFPAERIAVFAGS